MGIFPKSTQKNCLFLPKVGESKTVTVVGELKRVSSDNPEETYKKKGNISAGYYDILPVVDEDTGKEVNLKVNIWKFYFDLKAIEETLNIGDTIIIDHSDRGVYKITKK